MREWIALFGAAAFVGACSIADIPGNGAAPSTADGGTETASADSTSTKASSGDDEAPACVPKGTPAPPPPPDWRTFPSCECRQGGKARCVPGEDLPESAKDNLAACNGGSCVPDTLLETKQLKPCHSSKKVLGILIGEGRCLSLCVPAVADKKGLLDRGDGNTCAEDERCAPCFDNRNGGAPTGLCNDTGGLAPKPAPEPPPTCEEEEQKPAPAEDAGAVTPPPPVPEGPACCKGKGVCQKRTSIPSDGRWVLDRDDCASDELCAPKNVAPTPCSTNKYQGFCHDSCVIDESFPRGTCASGEKCVPCDDDGDPTRVPGCK